MAASAGSGTVALKKDYGDRLVVKASVDSSTPLDFLVDTGASAHVVFDNIRDHVALPEPAGATAVISFAGLKAAPRVALSSLEVGAWRETGVSAVLLDDWADRARTPQGLVGLDFFEDQVVVLDTRKGELRGYRRDEAPVKLSRWRAAPFRRETFGIVREPLLLTSMRIGDLAAEALVDTGAAISVCNVPAINKLKTVPPVRSTRQEVADANGGVIQSYEVSTSRVEIGERVIENVTLLVSDAPFFRTIGYATTPFCILGLDLLGPGAFAIDYGGGQLLFEPG